MSNFFFFDLKESGYAAYLPDNNVPFRVSELLFLQFPLLKLRGGAPSFTRGQYSFYPGGSGTTDCRSRVYHLLPEMLTKKVSTVFGGFPTAIIVGNCSYKKDSK